MPLPSGSVTVGFDIGGTNLRGAAVDTAGRIVDSAQVPTPATADELESAVAEIVAHHRRGHEVTGVGLAVAGFLDPECTTVRFAPHLPWRDAPVRDILRDRLGVPVTLEHDANAAAWGEYRFGAARGARIWVLFAVGTGIGGALMIDGRLYRGAYGTAPEFGHLTVVRDGRPCSCGKSGCLERYCSGTALVETAREIIDGGADGTYGLSAAYRENGEAELTGRAIMDAARVGDPVAAAAVADYTAWLGQGLSVVADVLDPELIVIGGGVSTDSDLWLDDARTHFSESIVGAGHRPVSRLTTAELGADAGMIGVADLARCES
ncbi:ROK family glucokinase [Corynebacterium pygosceleis]|uniref:ROK family glucokinase n=1 Tax=Corynebacterium pygosceleis TaxID=2800406 RepID=UPI001908127E|nr:ROK family glucokinase [Corynebacterium pygosceleis]MCL0120589.1 ROK family glucokinase [Corynebacterium pygosceleis]